MTNVYMLALFGLLCMQAASNAHPTATTDLNANCGIVEPTEITGKGESNSSKIRLSQEQTAKLNTMLSQIPKRNFTHIENGSSSIEEINWNANFSSVPHQGDIILTPEQVREAQSRNRTKRSAPMRGSQYLWDKTTFIPYSIAPELSTKAANVIRTAVRFWQSNTCLTFKENAYGVNSIRFIKGNGCFSNLGRIYNQAVQNISIGSGCESVGKAAHEIAHALGFQHTQVRHDRDNYVIVNVKNIDKDVYENFGKKNIYENDNHGLPYEYGSVMHYDGYALAVNEKQPTIVAHDRNHQDTMGNRRLPTFNDVLMMNKHYQCLGRCPRSSLVCYNGGYRHVRDCSKCLCPSGFAGTECKNRPNASKCGRSVVPTSSWQTLQGEAGDRRKVERSNFDECVFWIRSEDLSTIKVEIELKQAYGVCWKACEYGGVEIKADEDKTLTGYTFCCKDSNGRKFTAIGGVIPIITSNKYFVNGFRLRYRLAP